MTMKIRISFTVNLDPDAWALDQGLDPKDKPAIREDLQNYVEGYVQEWLADRGMLHQEIYSQGTQTREGGSI